MTGSNSIVNYVITEFKATGAKQTEDAAKAVGSGFRQLGDRSADAGRGFSNLSKGLGGFVGAYAGAAATFFALQQAYSALKNAAGLEQTIQGTRLLASTISESGDQILASVTKITRGQLTLKDTAESINLALSSGFNVSQINELASIATKASTVLGRDLGDSFIRLSRGVTKLEPELLDELGIFTRIEPAVRAYGSQVGKAENALTNYERRQAFANAVIEEGNRRYAVINTSTQTAAASIERLGSTIINLAQSIGGLLAKSLQPFADFLSGSLANSLSAIGILAALGFKKAGQIFSLFISETFEKGLTKMNDNWQNRIRSWSKLDPKVIDNIKDIAKNFDTKGANVSSETTSLIEAVRKGNVNNSTLLKLKDSINESRKEDVKNIKDIFVRSKIDPTPLLNSLSEFNGLKGKELNEAIVQKFARLNITSSNRGSVAGTLTKGELLDAQRAVKAAVPNTEIITSLNKYEASMSSGAKATSAFFNAIQIGGGFIGKLTAGLGSLLSTISIWATGITLIGGLLLKILGKENFFDNLIDSTLAFGSKLVGLTKEAEATKKAIASLADVGLSDALKKRNLSSKDSFSFDTSFLGIGFERKLSGEDLSKKQQDIIKGAIAEAAKFENLQRKVKANGNDINKLNTEEQYSISRYMKDFKNSSTADIQKTIFGEAIQKNIVKFMQDFVPNTNEAAMAMRAFIESLEKLKDFDTPSIIQALSVVSLSTGLGVDELIKNLDVAKLKLNQTGTAISYTFDTGITSRELLKFEELEKQKQEIRKKYANSPLEANRRVAELDTSQKVIRQDIATSSRITSLTTELDTANQLSLEGLSQTTDALNKQIAKREADIDLMRGSLALYTMAYGLGSAEVVNKEKELSIEEKILETQKKQVANLSGRSQMAQNVLQAQNMIARSYTAELNASNRLNGFYNERNELAMTELEVQRNKFNLLVGFANLNTGPPGQKGDKGELERLKSLAIQVMNGAVATKAIEAQTLAIEVEKQNIQAISEIQQRRISTILINNLTYIQDIEAAQKLVSIQYEHQTKQLDYANQLIQLQAQIAQVNNNREIQNLQSKNKILDVQSNINKALLDARNIAVETANVSVAGTLQSRQEFANKFSNLFTEQQKDQFTIDINENQLSILKQTTENNVKALAEDTAIKQQQLDNEVKIAERQLQAAQITAGAEAARIENDLKKLDLEKAQATAEYEARVKILNVQSGNIALERANTQLKIESDFKIREIEIGLLDKRRELIEYELKGLLSYMKELDEVNSRYVSGLLLATQQLPADIQLKLAAQTITEIDAIKETANRIVQLGSRVNVDALQGLVSRISTGTGPALGALNQQTKNQLEEQANADANKKEKAIQDEKKQADERYKNLITDIQSRRDLFDKEKGLSGATLQLAKEGYEQTLQEVEKRRSLISLEEANQRQRYALDLKKAETDLERLKVMAQYSKDPFLRFFNDLAGILKDDLTKGILDLNTALIEGTLTLDNFNQGVRDWARSLVLDIQKALVQQTIVTPITDFVQKQVGSIAKDIFQIDIFGKKDLSSALTPDGSALNVNVINGSTSSSGVGGLASQSDDVFARQSSEWKQFTSDFGNYGIALTGTFASILASGGDFKTALIGIFASLFAQIIRNLVTGGSITGVAGGIGSGIGNLLGGFSWDGMASGSFLESLSSQALGNIAGGAAGLASGGSVTRMAGGGMAGRDVVPTWLEQGEFVTRKSAVDSIGLHNMQRMNNLGSNGIQPNVSVVMQNNGTPQEVQGKPSVKFNGTEIIVGVILKDLQNNGPIRQTLRGGSL